MGRPSKLTNDATSSIAARHHSAQAPELIMRGMSNVETGNPIAVSRAFPIKAHLGFRRTHSETSLTNDHQDANSLVLDLSRRGCAAVATPTTVQIQTLDPREDESQEHRNHNVRHLLSSRNKLEEKRSGLHRHGSDGAQPDSTVVGPEVHWANLQGQSSNHSRMRGGGRQLPHTVGIAEYTSHAHTSYDQVVHTTLKRSQPFSIDDTIKASISKQDGHQSTSGFSLCGPSLPLKKSKFDKDSVKFKKVPLEQARGSPGLITECSTSSLEQQNQKFVTFVIGNNKAILREEMARLSSSDTKRGHVFNFTGQRHSNASCSATLQSVKLNSLKEESRNCSSPSVSSSVGSEELQQQKTFPLTGSEDDRIVASDCKSPKWNLMAGKH